MSNEKEGVPAELLKQATYVPQDLNLEAYNPMENIATLTVGDDFSEGMMIAGYFEETQILASPKFKFSNTRNEKGVPTSLRHIIRVGSPTGPRLGIWSCGELRVAFEKLTPGTFITITYKGKGENSKGQEQHFFDLMRPVPSMQ